MAIQVKVSRIRHNGKVFHSGEVIEKIKSNEAKRLVDSGHAFFIEKSNDKSEGDNQPPEGKE